MWSCQDALEFFGRMVLNRGTGELIFTRKNGKQWNKGNQKDPMHDACVAANIEPLGFHQLRHLHASALIKRNVGMPVAAKQLGHTTATLERHYMHLDPKFVEQVIRGAFDGEPVSDNVARFRPKRTAGSK
jgi:integrase